MLSGVSRRLQYTHIVVFTEDAGVFALARDENTNRAEYFLIVGNEEKVYRRNNRIDQWQLLEQDDLASILQSICHAIAQGQTVLKMDGRSDRIINRNN